MKSLRLLWITCGCALAACGGAGGTDTPLDVSLPTFVGGVQHHYFPLDPGTVRVYEGVDEGAPRKEEVETLAEPREILGVTCTGLQQRVWVDGAYRERTVEWYAEDERGNVWKFGEESFDIEQGQALATLDSWIAGEDGHAPWLAFPASPQTGAVFHDDQGTETIEILTVSAVAAVQAGTFFDCLRLSATEDGEEEDADIMLYASGVGRVHEVSQQGTLQLVDIERR